MNLHLKQLRTLMHLFFSLFFHSSAQMTAAILQNEGHEIHFYCCEIWEAWTENKLLSGICQSSSFPLLFNPSYVYGMFYKVAHYTNGHKCRGHCALDFLCSCVFKSQFWNAARVTWPERKLNANDGNTSHRFVLMKRLGEVKEQSSYPVTVL